MTAYLTRRFLQMIVVLLVLSFVLVALMRAMPGDPIDQYRVNPNMRQSEIDRLRAYYGLNDPVDVFYAKQMRRYFVEFDLGYSRMTNRPVGDELLPKIGNTLKLTVSALLLALLVAIPVGVYCAAKQYSPFDYTVNFLAFVGLSFPSFFLAFLLIWVFSVRLGILPPGGMSSGPGAGLPDELRHLILPTLALATLSIGSWTRYMRSSMLEVVKLDYVRTAVAKGLDADTVLWRHAFRNAMIPMITILGLSIPALFGGALITETVFNWPGMGRALYDSVMQRDYNVAIVAFMFLAFLTLLFNVLADVCYALADPRIRLA